MCTGEAEDSIPEVGLAGTIAWAGGCSQHGLWEENTLKLLRHIDMNVAFSSAVTTAVERADEAADAVRVVPMLPAISVDEQAVQLLLAEFADESRDSLLDRWNGFSTEGVFKGSVLVHVLVRATDGRLMGFAKGFIMAVQARVSEVYLDEVLVAEVDRGQRLLQHMIVALVDACKQAGSKVTRVRMQCVRGAKMIGGRSVNLHEQVYTPMNLGTEYQAPASTHSPWFETGPSDPSYIMLHGQGEAVREAVAALAAEKPLAMAATLSTHLGGWGAGTIAAVNAADAASAAAVEDPAPPVLPTRTHRPCRERRLLPPDSAHAAPGGLLEHLEALEHGAVSTRLQGTARMRLSQV